MFHCSQGGRFPCIALAFGSFGDLWNGVVDLRYRIDAENEGGEIVYTLAFKHAFSIVPEAA